MEIIYTLENNKNEINNSIFLAGPTYRIKDGFRNPLSWRKQAIKILNDMNYQGTIFNPEWKDDKKPNEWTYSRQVDWETKNLNQASVILFWIPRDLEKLPGLTTNIEFGEWMHSNKIVIGAPPDSPKNDYLKERCSRLGIQWYDTLQQCVNAAIKKNNENNIKIKGWFISDTHFGHKRTLELSKRPFNSVEEMNWTFVKNWNSKITNNDIVYHLGDFGDPYMIEHLNGKIIYFLPGNYENPQIIKQIKNDDRVIIIENNQRIVIDEGIEIKLIHEPEKADNQYDFYLFGHIHNLQMVKRNGLNVGVDCHNYSPIDIDTVLFYRNAILKHYDYNVFIDHLGISIKNKEN